MKNKISIIIVLFTMTINTTIFGQKDIYKTALIIGNENINNENSLPNNGLFYCENGGAIDLDYESKFALRVITKNSTKPFTFEKFIKEIDYFFVLDGVLFETKVPILDTIQKDCSKIRNDKQNIIDLKSKIKEAGILDKINEQNIDNFSVIVKVKFRDTICEKESYTDLPVSLREDIYTIRVKNYGIKFIINLDNIENNNVIWDAFLGIPKNLTYSTLDWAYSPKLNKANFIVLSTPVLRFDYKNVFLKNFDIEFVAIKEVTSSNENKNFIGYGGCIGLIGNESKLLKIGGYSYNEKGYFFIGLTLTGIYKSIKSLVDDVNKSSKAKNK